MDIYYAILIILLIIIGYILFKKEKLEVKEGPDLEVIEEKDD